MTHMPYNPAAIIFIYLITTISFSITRGFYSFGAISSLFLSFIIFAAYFKWPNFFVMFKKFDLNQSLIITLFVSILLSAIFYGGLYQERGVLYQTSNYLFLVAGLIAFTYLTTKKILSTTTRFGLLIIIGISLQVFMVISSPQPIIDVFVMLKYGAISLMNFQNPYAATFPAVYPGVVPNYFSYLPIAGIVFIPSTIIFSDPRITLIFANLLFAFVLKRLIGKSNAIASEIIPILYLFTPQATFLVEQSWIDPVVLSSLALFLFYAYKKKNTVLQTAALTITLGMKQQFLLLLLFLFPFKKISKTIIIASLVVVSAITFLFVMASPSEFFKDMTLLATLVVQKTNSLSLNAFVYNNWHFNVNTFIFVLIWFAGIFFVGRNKAQSFSHLTLSISLYFFIFYLFNYLAYLNYYPFVTGCMLLSICFAINEAKNSKNGA